MKTTYDYMVDVIYEMIDSYHVPEYDWVPALMDVAEDIERRQLEEYTMNEDGADEVPWIDPS